MLLFSQLQPLPWWIPTNPSCSLYYLYNFTAKCTAYEIFRLAYICNTMYRKVRQYSTVLSGCKATPLPLPGVGQA
jgi:hypothetical protein